MFLKAIKTELNFKKSGKGHARISLISNKEIETNSIMQIIP